MTVSLYIYPSSSSSKGNALDLTKTDVSLERVFTKKGSDDKDVKKTYSYPVSLTHLDYDKKIYEPCLINVVASVGYATIKTDTDTTGTKSTTLPTHSELVEFFTRMKVELVVDSTTIAKNYFVYKVHTKRQKDTTSSVTVELEIYSEDKLLTLEKYSKAYTGKKLGTDIFKNEIVKYDITNTDTEKAYKVNLQMLAYDTDEKDDDDKAIKNELRQPYLVQYNETFYDFLRRTANRCGEFLYFEDGKLNLGLTKTDKTSTDYLQDAVSYNFDSLYANSVFSDDKEVEYYNYNYLNNENGDSKHHAKSGSYHYSDPLAADEYLDLINGLRHTGWWDEQDWGKNVMMHLIKVLSGTSLGQITANAVLTIAEHNKEIIYEALRMNHDYRKENIRDYRGKDDLKDQWKDDSIINDLSQFATATDQKTSDITSSDINMNATFYSLIRKAEKTIGEVGEEALFIDFGSSAKSLSLGDIIKGEGRQYVVVQINGSYEYKAKDGSTTTKELVTTQQVVAIPLYEVTADSTTNYIPVPPALPQVCVRESQPQLAFVTHTVDPKMIGRVRIRFAWQEDKDDPSPWVRVSMPFATNGGGVKFKPDKDDEVLVSFEEGNVERPYVSGYLLSERSNQSWGHMPNRAIMSRNGHGITFSDPTSVGFFTNLVPAVDFVTSIVPEFFWPSFTEAHRVAALAGGMTLRDQYGLYEISMSSDKRSVSIQSSMGNVEVNAFTGITISAPNGDIKIEGKNVEIAASNTVKITSGKALESRYKSFWDPFKETLQDWVVEKILDMTLIRTLVETVLRPIDGTTSIKSFTFVQIEAGEGSVEYEVDKYAYETESAPKKFNKTVDLLTTFVSNEVVKIKTELDSLKSKLTSFEGMSGPGADMVNKDSNVITIDTICDKVKSSEKPADTDYNWAANQLENETFDSDKIKEKVKNDTGFEKMPLATEKDKNDIPYTDTVTNKTTEQFDKDCKAYSDSFKKHKDDELNRISKANQTKQTKRNELKKCVEELCDQYINARNVLENIKNDESLIKGSKRSVYIDAARKAFKAIGGSFKSAADDAFDKLSKGTLQSSADCLIDEISYKKLLKRKTILQFINEIRGQFNSDLYLKDAIPDTCTKVDAATEIDNDDKWKDYIDASLKENAAKETSEKSKSRRFKEWFDTNFLTPWKDSTINRKRWAEKTKGKILMSDSSATTHEFNNNEQLVSRPNVIASSQYIKKIKDRLKNL